MDQEYECVEFDRGRVRVANRRHTTQLGSKDVLIQGLAATWCGADTRTVDGDKTVPDGSPTRVVLGHEAVGLVIAVGSGVRSVRPGDIVSVLPHVYEADHLATCAYARAGQHELCVGGGHAGHAGFDHDGVMADFTVVEAERLVVIPTDVVAALSAAAPDLPAGALACSLEPILCVLCALERVRSSRAVRMRGARVLVQGAGHIGVLHALAWLSAGARVWVRDILPQREALAEQICDHDRFTAWSAQPETDLDVVVDTTGTAAALKQAFDLLADGGMIYLMAGLRLADRGAFDPMKALHLEQIHRHGLTIMMLCGSDTRWVSGHSGLRLGMVPLGVEFLAANARALSRMATGTIRGFASPTIESRSRLAPDWTSPDGEPAVLALLGGRAGTKDHVSPIVVPPTAARALTVVGAA